jgi:hypothetical protein
MATIIDEITAQNVGPVEHLSLPVPAGGGVIEITGRNGAGKSELIDAVGALAGGKCDVTRRDGTQEGKLSGMGVTIRFRGRVSRSGELEAESLEGKLSPADLVDPKLKTPEAADERRIKALLQLAGVEADATLFHELVGGQAEFERLVTPSAIETDDLILMASRIKRDIEGKARAAEATAENAKARSDAARKAVESIDLEVPDDQATLQAALEQAIAADAKLKADAEARQTAIDKAATARAYLSDAEAEYSGPTVDQAKQEVDAATRERDAADRAFEEAKQRLEAARVRYNLARSDLQTAEGHANTIASWRTQIDAAANVQPVDPAELAAARDSVVKAREAVERGAVVRNAKAQLKAAEASREEARQSQQQAEFLRSCAKGTDDVLSSQVGKLNCPLTVKTIDGKTRLVLQTGRGETFYSDLSHGERWTIALDIAIAAVGERGLIPVQQEAWESLDYEHQVQIDKQCRAAKVWLVTARASRKGESNELRAEVFS